MPYCKNCGSQVDEDQKFCSACGQELNGTPKSNRTNLNNFDEQTRSERRRAENSNGCSVECDYCFCDPCRDCDDLCSFCICFDLLSDGDCDCCGLCNCTCDCCPCC